METSSVNCFFLLTYQSLIRADPAIASSQIGQSDDAIPKEADPLGMS